MNTHYYALAGLRRTPFELLIRAQTLLPSLQYYTSAREDSKHPYTWTSVILGTVGGTTPSLVFDFAIDKSTRRDPFPLTYIVIHWHTVLGGDEWALSWLDLSTGSSGVLTCWKSSTSHQILIYSYALAIPQLNQLIAAALLLMAPTPFLSDMRFDHDVAESTATTPTVARPSLWNFRQPFDPKPWPSAATLVTFFFFMQIAII